MTGSLGKLCTRGLGASFLAFSVVGLYAGCGGNWSGKSDAGGPAAGGGATGSAGAPFGGAGGTAAASGSLGVAGSVLILPQAGSSSSGCDGGCGAAAMCFQDAECASNFCERLGGGDMIAGQCAACTAGGDCTSGVCVSGVCVAPSCSDAVWNGDETDVDCGGPCDPCSASQHCLMPADCASGVCNHIANPQDCIYGSSQCFVCGA